MIVTVPVAGKLRLDTVSGWAVSAISVEPSARVSSPFTVPVPESVPFTVVAPTHVPVRFTFAPDSTVSVRLCICVPERVSVPFVDTPGATTSPLNRS